MDISKIQQCAKEVGEINPLDLNQISEWRKKNKLSSSRSLIQQESIVPLLQLINELESIGSAEGIVGEYQKLCQSLTGFCTKLLTEDLLQSNSHVLLQNVGMYYHQHKRQPEGFPKALITAYGSGNGFLIGGHTFPSLYLWSGYAQIPTVSEGNLDTRSFHMYIGEPASKNEIGDFEPNQMLYIGMSDERVSRPGTSRRLLALANFRGSRMYDSCILQPGYSNLHGALPYRVMVDEVRCTFSTIAEKVTTRAKSVRSLFNNPLGGGHEAQIIFSSPIGVHGMHESNQSLTAATQFIELRTKAIK